MALYGMALHGMAWQAVQVNAAKILINVASIFRN